MLKRCIMIFPEFNNIHTIDRIRNKYDPLSKLVRPHITLVFPFESNISTQTLQTHIETATSGMKPIQLIMKNITGAEEPNGKYLFLNIYEGAEQISALSKKLYTGILAKYKFENHDTFYTPHMTVGKLDKTEDFTQAVKDTQNEKSQFETTLKCISVEIIGDDESSTIETHVQL